MGSLFKGREKRLAPSQAYLNLLGTSVPCQTSKLGVHMRRILNASSDNGVCSGTSFDHSENVLVLYAMGYKCRKPPN